MSNDLDYVKRSEVLKILNKALHDETLSEEIKNYIFGTLRHEVLILKSSMCEEDFIQCGVEYWLKYFNIDTRDWHDEDGNYCQTSFIITRKE